MKTHTRHIRTAHGNAVAGVVGVAASPSRRPDQFRRSGTVRRMFRARSLLRRERRSRRIGHGLRSAVSVRDVRTGRQPARTGGRSTGRSYGRLSFSRHAFLRFRFYVRRPRLCDGDGLFRTVCRTGCPAGCGGIAAAAGSSRFHCIVFVSARRKDDSFVCKRGSVFT